MINALLVLVHSFGRQRFAVASNDACLENHRTTRWNEIKALFILLSQLKYFSRVSCSLAKSIKDQLFSFFFQLYEFRWTISNKCLTFSFTVPMTDLKDTIRLNWLNWKKLRMKWNWSLNETDCESRRKLLDLKSHCFGICPIVLSFYNKRINA